MPTNRKRKSRNRLEPTPNWAERLLNDKHEPERGTAGHDGYIGWRFFYETVPGLPDADSSEGYRLISEIKGSQRTMAIDSTT